MYNSAQLSSAQFTSNAISSVFYPLSDIVLSSRLARPSYSPRIALSGGTHLVRGTMGHGECHLATTCTVVNTDVASDGYTDTDVGHLFIRPGCFDIGQAAFSGNTHVDSMYIDYSSSSLSFGEDSFKGNLPDFTVTRECKEAGCTSDCLGRSLLTRAAQPCQDVASQVNRAAHAVGRRRQPAVLSTDRRAAQSSGRRAPERAGVCANARAGRLEHR